MKDLRDLKDLTIHHVKPVSDPYLFWFPQNEEIRLHHTGVSGFLRSEVWLCLTRVDLADFSQVDTAYKSVNLGAGTRARYATDLLPNRVSSKWEDRKLFHHNEDTWKLDFMLFGANPATIVVHTISQPNCGRARSPKKE